ncbi:MAG: hypothetical protein NWE80_04985 [Candidatus Bathyarchaeota archaeon]|nr:hypothetical protein [Candidatus Bathyarchaeota archaeon]
MKILALDIGAGTVDVLLYDDGKKRKEKSESTEVEKRQNESIRLSTSSLELG